MEAQLQMANGIMKLAELAEKIHKRINAKLEKLIEMEKVSHGHDYWGKDREGMNMMTSLG